MKDINDNSCIRIYDKLSETIKNGYNGDTALPSLRRLCDDYGTSVNTMRKAIAMAVENGLLVKGANGRVSIKPSGEKSRNTVAVGVVSIDNPLWTQALRGAEDRFAAENVVMTSLSHDRDPEKLMKQLEKLSDFNLRGLIIAPLTVGGSNRPENSVETEFRRVLGELEASGVKLVFIDRYLYDRSVPCVTSDNFGSAYRLTRLMLSRGVSRPAFIGLSGLTTSDERLGGFLTACQNCLTANYISGSGSGAKVLTIDSDTEDLTVSLDRIAAQTAGFLRSERPDAVLTMNDQLARVFLRAAEQSGLAVPDALPLYTFDRTNLCTATGRSFPGIDQDFYAMGAEAARLMLELLDGTAPAGNSVVASKLTVN